jgi:hypothetical protein
MFLPASSDLSIVNHDANFLSMYAHNQTLLVKGRLSNVPPEFADDPVLL